MTEQVVYRKLKRYKYQTLEQYLILTELRPKEKITSAGGWITLDTDGRLVIKKFYCWDGASGATFDTKTSMRASLVHDALYQLMREGLLPQEFREPADDLFWKICLEDGMWRFRAWSWRKGLGFAGFAAALNKGPEIDTLTAP